MVKIRGNGLKKNRILINKNRKMDFGGEWSRIWGKKIKFVFVKTYFKGPRLSV